MKSNIKKAALIVTLAIGFIFFSGVSDLWAKGKPDLKIEGFTLGKNVS